MQELSFEAMLRAIEIAVSSQFEQQGTVPNRGVLITRGGLIDHPLEWSSDDERRQVFAGLRRRIDAMQPERYVVIGEAWLAPRSANSPLLRASKSDLRFEAVYIFLVDRSGENCLITRPIETPHWSKDPTRCLGRINVEPDLDVNFVDLLAG